MIISKTKINSDKKLNFKPYEKKVKFIMKYAEQIYLTNLSHIPLNI